MRTEATIDWSKYLRRSEEPLPSDGAADYAGEIVMPADLRPELDLLYETGIQPGVSTGWSRMDGHFSVVRGQWTVITGIPGSGKSAFLDSLMMQMAIRWGWKWGVFSAENLPLDRYVAGLVENYTNKPFNRGPSERVSREEIDTASGFIEEHFALIPPVDGVTVEYLLAVADKLVLGFGISGLILDPWNELEHRRDRSMTEADYLSQALSRIRRFARTRKIHVFVVAHPRLLQKEGKGYPVPTPYDISGGAQWWNKADNALAVWRDYKTPGSPTQVHIQKIRFREVGTLGMVELYYDTVSGRFNEREGTPF